MTHEWWHVWGEVGERSNRTLDTGQIKSAFNSVVPEGKRGTETLDAIGNWFNNTAYGKRFKAGQEREDALQKTLIDQGGPYALYAKIKNQPNELEQQILGRISDITNIDPRITTPATYLALSGGLRGTARGISNVARSPKAMQGLKNILPNTPAAERVVKVKAQTIHGKPIPAETSASVLKKGSMFKKGSLSESRAIEQSRFLRAMEGDPTAGVLAYDAKKTWDGIGARDIKGKEWASSRIDPDALLERQKSPYPGQQMKRGELKAKIVEMQKTKFQELPIEQRLPKIKEELLGGKNVKWIDDKTGERISLQKNTKEPFKTRFIGWWSREKRDPLRKATENIPLEEVQKLAKKYNVPDEVAFKFIENQANLKKVVDTRIKKINARIKANPNAYPKGFKASLGHGKAAKYFVHSANIASNLEPETFLTNVTRSNKDEVSEAFNRALGRSLDLEEEFLKFIDKDLGSFHKGLKLGKNKKELIIQYVRKNIAKSVNWKSWKKPDGTPMFKSKEDYLINEATKLSIGALKRAVGD